MSITDGESKLIAMRQGMLDARDFLSETYYLAQQGKRQEAFDRLLPLAQLEATQLQQCVDLQDAKASTGASGEIAQYNNYSPHDSDVEDAISVIKKPDNSLTSNIAMSIVGNLMEGGISRVEEKVENILRLAEIDIQSPRSHEKGTSRNR